MPGVTTHALSLLLPDGTIRWVALFTTPPAPDASSGVEVSAAGYARVAHSAWTTADDGGTFFRSNNGAIEFPAFEFPTSAGRIEAIGIYSAAVAGNLILWSPCAMVEDLSATDQVRIVTGTLRFGATP